MLEALAAQLLKLAEPMAALSIDHLTPLTRRKLADNALSVHAYPNEYAASSTSATRTRPLRPRTIWPGSSTLRAARASYG